MTPAQPDSGKPPAVSVIIPAYRVTAYISEALDSVLAQTFADYEIIVVNDGCPDTAALERALEPYRGRIRYVKQANSGPGGARNAGLREARAGWVALLDGDDAWEPQYLASQIGLVRADPRIDVLYANAVYFGDTPLAGRPLMDYSPSEGEVTFARLARSQCVVLVSVLARRETLLRAGLFNPALRCAEDFDLWLRVSALGGRIAYQRKTLWRYRVRGGSQSADSVAMRRAGLQVLDTLGRSLPLNDADRRALEEGRRRFQADLAYFQGRQALAAGDAETARRYYQAANRHFRKPKLAVACLALRWFPKLACAIARRHGTPV